LQVHKIETVSYFMANMNRPLSKQVSRMFVTQNNPHTQLPTALPTVPLKYDVYNIISKVWNIWGDNLSNYVSAENWEIQKII